MQEIADGIYHWTAMRETIGAPVSSYWVRPAGIVTDPMLPEEGLDAFAGDGLAPQQVVLSTGLHTRDAEQIAQALEIPIRAPQEARERLGDRLAFTPFRDHEEIAPGVQAVHIGILAPDEYALHISAGGGAILFADALHHYGDTLGFFPDDLLGDDPQAVKDGLREQLRALLERDFAHLLFAHGAPLVGTGKQALRDFLAA
jgi:hypothetical protein